MLTPDENQLSKLVKKAIDANDSFVWYLVGWLRKKQMQEITDAANNWIEEHQEEQNDD